MSTFAPVEREDWIDPPEGLTRIDGGSVSTPAGFAAAAAATGAKGPETPDVGLLVSTRPAVSWLVDTINAIPSEPVRLNRRRDRGGFQAVVVNSGRANAATGAEGFAHAEQMAARVASGVGCEPAAVAVCSTGTIGEPLIMSDIEPAIDAAAAGLGAEGGAAFGRAICTTDSAPKGGAFRLALAGGEVTIGAAAKGAGMIRPTMATMLAYLTTDAAIAADDLRRLVQRAADESFNRISVDGQMSPSDTLLMLANGDGEPLAGPDLEHFGLAVCAVCRWLAVQMVKDGEGAEHVVRVMVSGARDDEEAERVARAVGESSLVKTAVFGNDPNWGRLSQAVGQALARTRGIPPDLAITIAGCAATDPGLAEAIRAPEYDIEIGLGRGSSRWALWASDLTHAYVTINAEYHT